MCEMIIPKPHKGVAVLKTKKAEWLVVNGEVEEDLARASEQVKERIVGAVMRRNGLPSSQLRVVSLQDKVIGKKFVIQALEEFS